MKDGNCESRLQIAFLKDSNILFPLEENSKI